MPGRGDAPTRAKEAGSMAAMVRSQEKTRRALFGTPALLGGVLAACGQAASRTDEAPQPSGQPVTLRFLGRGNQVILDVQRRIADNFQKANPRIKVEMQAASNYLQQLMAELAGGSASDVAFTAMGDFRVLAKQGGLRELDTFMARDFKKGDYYDYAID